MARYYKAVGCHRCNRTGYRGRVAVHEVLVVDEKVKEMIVKGANEPEIANYCIENGMTTLVQDGIEKYKEGITTYEEIVRVLI